MEASSSDDDDSDQDGENGGGKFGAGWGKNRCALCVWHPSGPWTAPGWGGWYLGPLSPHPDLWLVRRLFWDTANARAH